MPVFFLPAFSGKGLPDLILRDGYRFAVRCTQSRRGGATLIIPSCDGSGVIARIRLTVFC